MSEPSSGAELILREIVDGAPNGGLVAALRSAYEHGDTATAGRISADMAVLLDKMAEDLPLRRQLAISLLPESEFVGIVTELNRQAARLSKTAEGLAPEPPKEAKSPLAWIQAWVDKVRAFAHEKERWLYIDQGQTADSRYRFGFHDPVLNTRVTLTYSVDVKHGLPYRHLTAAFSLNAWELGVIPDGTWWDEHEGSFVEWFAGLSMLLFPMHDGLSFDHRILPPIPVRDAHPTAPRNLHLRYPIALHGFVRHDLDAMTASETAEAEARSVYASTTASGLVDSKGRPLS